MLLPVQYKLVRPEYFQFFSPVLRDIAYFIHPFVLITQYVVTIITLYKYV